MKWVLSKDLLGLLVVNRQIEIKRRLMVFKKNMCLFIKA